MAYILRGLAEPAHPANANKTGHPPSCSPPPPAASPLASPLRANRARTRLVPVTVLLVLALGVALWATGLVDEKPVNSSKPEGLNAQSALQVPPKAADRNPTVVGTLPPKTGTLQLTSTPSGATVTIRPLGTPTKENPVASIAPAITPASISLPVGEYAVEFVLSGHFSIEQRVQITAGKALPFSMVLEAQRGPLSGQTWTHPELGFVLLPVEKGEFEQGPGPNGA